MGAGVDQKTACERFGILRSTHRRFESGPLELIVKGLSQPKGKRKTFEPVQCRCYQAAAWPCSKWCPAPEVSRSSRDRLIDWLWFSNGEMMDATKVAIGQRWQRKNGVVYFVAESRGQSSIDFLLVPVEVPAGVKARKTWKWEQGIRHEMKCVTGGME